MNTQPDDRGRHCPRCGTPLHITQRGYLYCPAQRCTWGLDCTPQISANCGRKRVA